MIIQRQSTQELRKDFNKKCHYTNCRFNTKQVNHDFCIFWHGPIYEEINKRENK